VGRGARGFGGARTVGVVPRRAGLTVRRPDGKRRGAARGGGRFSGDAPRAGAARLSELAVAPRSRGWGSFVPRRPRLGPQPSFGTRGRRVKGRAVGKNWSGRRILRPPGYFAAEFAMGGRCLPGRERHRTRRVRRGHRRGCGGLTTEALCRGPADVPVNWRAGPARPFGRRRGAWAPARTAPPTCACGTAVGGARPRPAATRGAGAGVGSQRRLRGSRPWTSCWFGRTGGKTVRLQVVVAPVGGTRDEGGRSRGPGGGIAGRRRGRREVRCAGGLGGGWRRIRPLSRPARFSASVGAPSALGPEFVPPR